MCVASFIRFCLRRVAHRIAVSNAQGAHSRERRETGARDPLEVNIMNAENRIDDKQRRIRAVLRRAGDAWLRALAAHTPAGPSSLATGQAGAARHRQSCDCPGSIGPAEGAPRAFPSHMDFAAMSKQVYWV